MYYYNNKREKLLQSKEKLNIINIILEITGSSFKRASHYYVLTC